MKTALAITFMLACAVTFAQEKDTVKDTVAYKAPRYYNISPCGGCPSNKLPKDPQEENRDYSPYQWDHQKPIVIEDTTLLKWLILNKAIIKEDTDHSIL